MLDIHNIETIDKKKLNIVKKKSKKTQILLFDTQRRVDDYVSKLKYRNNGNYDDIPHYIVSKLGYIYKVFDTKYSSNTFNDPLIDKKTIKIAVENLGWLNKNTITGVLNNWIGDPYRSEPYIKNWRGHYFWDKYTDLQLDSLSELCEQLCEEHNIYKQCVPGQGYIENIYNFKGIVCKSNFSNIYTDINPSFNFRIFFNNAKEINK
jgi:N-acetylmuramoyl-L-alanine amidase